ncbi:hypothetical protein BH23CHL5_BH23CHL5_17430 [soil metagenome]
MPQFSEMRLTSTVSCASEPKDPKHEARCHGCCNKHCERLRRGMMPAHPRHWRSTDRLLREGFCVSGTYPLNAILLGKKILFDMTLEKPNRNCIVAFMQRAAET